MKTRQLNELVDYATWADDRDQHLQAVLEVKRPRRIAVGPHLTYLFENTETVRWQVQEMMRIERIVRARDIEHELQTYNELLGAPGELGCTLLIEIETPEERAVKLRAWLDLPKHLYARLEDGEKVYAVFDARQVGEDRVSAVQYLRFPVGGRAPIALGSDHPNYRYEDPISEEQRAALAADLSDGTHARNA